MGNGDLPPSAVTRNKYQLKFGKNDLKWNAVFWTPLVQCILQASVVIAMTMLHPSGP